MTRLLERILFYDLLLTAVAAPLAFGTVEYWSIAVFELNAMFLLVVWALDNYWGQLALRSVLPSGWLVGPCAVLLLLNVAQALVPGLSLDPWATQTSAVKVLALFIYLLVALRVLATHECRKQFLLGLSAFGFGLALLAIAQKLSYNGKLLWIRPVAPDATVPYGPYANYNHFAGAMEMLWPLPFAYWLFARAEVGRRMLACFAAIVMAAALVFSLSRGGVLALVLQLVAFIVIVRRNVTGLADRTPLLLGGAVAVMLLFSLWLGYDRLVTRLQLFKQGSQETSVATRREFWQASWLMFRAHPLTGVGLGAFPAVYPQYGHSSANLERLETAHNDYLQVLTDGGLVAGAGLLWLLGGLLWHIRRTAQRFNFLRSHDRACFIGSAVAVLGIAVHSAYDFNLQITANALLCLLVLALLARVQTDKE